MTSPDATQTRLSILMLEDNSLDSELTVERLRAAHFEFDHVVAASRAEFEQCLERFSFDLVLADFSLPDFDGLTALSIIRERDQHLPFIFVSGVLGEEVAIETLHRGATDYVLKHRLDRLPPAVRRAMGVYAEHRSRVKAEQQLRESEQLFQRLTDALPAMVWTTDSRGRLTYSNDAWHEYMGGDRSESWWGAANLHPDDLRMVSETWKEALGTHQAMELECRFLRASDQSYRWHLVRAIPLHPEDLDSRWVGACTDVEAQKQREDALRTAEKLAAVGRMAGVIAHEINNPLESLANLMYLLRNQDTRVDPGLSLLREAEEQLFRIASITRQTLTFHRDKLMPVIADCRGLIEEAVAVFRARLRNENIDVRIRVEDSLKIQGKTGELRQVFVNLIGNAVDAMREGGTLSLYARQMKDTVQIDIEDSGAGIRADVLPQLFRPFFSTKGTVGTGLGLWISRGIVQEHGGSITVTSEPGRTIFSLAFPLAAVPDLTGHTQPSV